MIEWFRGRYGQLSDVDRAISRRIAQLPATPLASVMKALSMAANKGLLWFAIAAVLGIRKGVTRRAALRGVLAITGTSFTANALLKPVLPRRRPAASELPAYQRIDNPPTSSSFPSGHAASAAAFTTALWMESPKLGMAVAPVAAAVAYSRVHVGVHWPSDVVAGTAVGAGVALATRRWWPMRRGDEALARPLDGAPALPGGEGLLLVANPLSGDAERDPVHDISQALPAATVLPTSKDEPIEEQLSSELRGRDGSVRAIGVAGGDGTVAAAAAVAGQHKLPLVLVPAGTLNHFARDVGVYDLQEAVDASQAGEAVAVGLGVVEVHPGDEGTPHRRYFINTASLGCYPDLVRLREKWQDRWGKWPAFAAALWVTLRRAEPVRVRIEGKEHRLWVLFVGNGPYHPTGMIPAWRPQLDSGLLDIRYLRADKRFSRLRAFTALALGALGHSRTYSQRTAPTLDVELVDGHGILATDGEVREEAGRFRFRVADAPITVYRRNEENWPDRERPHHAGRR
ncbi:MAG: phosphoesterase PA-phosphatase related protein [Pseudonocardia sp.]|nr:phosphoesterase PA-phosphatase related protein [Pseudonocardia sp.]